MREESVEMPRGNQKAPPTKFPPSMRVGEVQVLVKVPPQKKATTLGQACCRGVGGGVWLKIVESHTAFSDVDQERRRCKHDKIKNFSWASSTGKNSDLGTYGLQCVASTTRLFGHDKKGAEGYLRGFVHELRSHGNRQNGSKTPQ